MASTSEQQSRPARKEYELIKTTTEKPLGRLIHKLGDSTGESNKSIQQDDPEPKSTEPKVFFPRFGPCYGKDTDAMKTAKEDCWQRILKKHPDEEQSLIRGIYLSAIKRVEKEARDSYEPTILKPLRKSQFRELMLKDGCFFLQVALHILGGSQLLGFPEKHIYFGKHNKKQNRQWIEAMFFPGNQIPYVIIHELMRQRFFQKIITQGNWSLPTDDLPAILLYLLVVSPHLGEILERQKLKKYISSFLPGGKESKDAPYLSEWPSDLLHALHCLVLGSGDAPIDRKALHATYDPESGREDDNNRFPSASEVKQLGITFRIGEQGIRGINFQDKWYTYIWAKYLYVPPLTLDENTELIIENLKNYEIRQGLGKNKYEVTSYLRLMSDLIQTRSDVRILEDRKIIQVKSGAQRDMLPEMLNRLASSHPEIGFTPNLRLTRQKIVKYSPDKYVQPWQLVILAFIFALVQTVFTVLGFALHRD